MNNIVSILNNYKGKTVDEVIELINRQDEERSNAETIRRHNYEEFLKSREGKHFIINFNGTSFIVLYVDHLNIYQSSTKMKVINIYRGEYYKIHIESRDINHSWFLNPYETFTYGGPAVKECKEITKEEYDNIMNECSNIMNTINSFDLK